MFSFPPNKNVTHESYISSMAIGTLPFNITMSRVNAIYDGFKENWQKICAPRVNDDLYTPIESFLGDVTFLKPISDKCWLLPTPIVQENDLGISVKFYMLLMKKNTREVILNSLLQRNTSSMEILIKMYEQQMEVYAILELSSYWNTYIISVKRKDTGNDILTYDKLTNSYFLHNGLCNAVGMILDNILKEETSLKTSTIEEK